MDNYKEYLDPADGYALVKQSVNMPRNPDWIEIPEGADCLMQWPTGHKVFYRNNFAKSWNSAYREWQFVSGDDGIDQSSTLWKRATQDPALISGAEAKLAWANGEALQINKKDTHFGFIDISNDYSLGVFDNEDYEFRLKPQTIKVELELPKPFEPKDNDWVWTISGVQDGGITQMLHRDGNDYPLGAWRTEEEVKQVVEQLRKIRGAS